MEREREREMVFRFFVCLCFRGVWWLLLFCGWLEERRLRRRGWKDGDFSLFLQEGAASLLLGLLLVVGVGLADLPDEVVEDLVDVDLGLGRGLEEGAAAKLAGKTLTLLGGDDALVLQVALVSDEDHGDLCWWVFAGSVSFFSTRTKKRRGKNKNKQSRSP